MSDVVGEVRSFIAKIDPAWQRAVMDPLQYDSDEVWRLRDTVPEVCNNLIVAAALVVLAYYDYATRRLKREPRSATLDTLLNKLLVDSSDPLQMTSAQGLTVLEWALECDVIPLVGRDSLKARHVILLNVLARQRTDAYHRDYQRYFDESSKTPITDLVHEVLRAVSFLADVRPELEGSAYAQYGAGEKQERIRFPLGPFFIHSQEGELLPFWRFDPSAQKYVYQSLWSNREVRRPKPSRADAVKGQRLVTALLSSSYRPLAELARMTCWFLQKHRASLHRVTKTEGNGRGAKQRFSSEEFDRDPLIATWRLITEHGPIGLLERDGDLAEYVFRQVHSADDDQAIRELEVRTKLEHVSLERLLAVEAARLLGLEVNPPNDVGTLDQLSEQCGGDLTRLDAAEDDLVNFADACVAKWSREVERELRFLLIFYLNLPFRRGGTNASITREDVTSVFEKKPGLFGLWNLFEAKILGDPMISAALFDFTGRSAVMDENDREATRKIVDAVAGLRNPRMHYKHDDDESRLQDLRTNLREFLKNIDRLIEILRGGKQNAVRPVHPYVLVFKTAMFTSGGLTILQYSSRLGGNKTSSDVVVYTARQIEVARAYYCLPKAGQSAFATGDQKSVLVDPLLVDAHLIDHLVPEPEASDDSNPP